MIQNEIDRIVEGKANLRTAIRAKGTAPTPHQSLDDYATYISNIDLGGIMTDEVKAIVNKTATTVTVPATVTILRACCFYSCTALQEIVMLPTTPPTRAIQSLTNTNNCPIYVPDESLETYQNEWQDLASRIQPLSARPVIYDFTNATAESERIPVDSTKTRSVYISKNGVLNGWMTTEYDGLYITGQYVSFPYFIKRKVTDDVGLYNDSSQNRGLSIDCQGYNTIKIYNGNNLVDWTTTEFFPYIKNCVSIASNAKSKTLKVNEGFENQHIDLCVFQHITISKIELYNS